MFSSLLRRKPHLDELLQLNLPLSYRVPQFLFSPEQAKKESRMELWEAGTPPLLHSWIVDSVTNLETHAGKEALASYAVLL